MHGGQVVALIVVAVICAFIGEAIGKRKGRRDLGGILGFFLGVIGLLIIACMSKTKEAMIAEAQQQYEIQAEAARRTGYVYPPYPPQPPDGPAPWPQGPQE
jgi:hypothetical protein